MNFPKKVTIVEVGPRDGLQNLAQFLETEKKIQLIKLLAAAGLKSIEATSFVHPKVIPQFRDAKDIISGLSDLKEVRIIALVPNAIGVQNALVSGVRDLSFVFSVSETHNQKNVNKTREESLAELKNIMALGRGHTDLSIRVVLSTVFGCPYEGEINLEDILLYIERVGNLGITEVILADTVGYGRPNQVRQIVRSCSNHFPSLTFGVHFHNTRGLGLANVLVCLEEGITIYDASVGGLGGCPFVPRATGNIATEDLVFMLAGMDIESGVDLEALFQATRFVAENLPDATLTSSVFQAGLPKRGNQLSCPR